jgi:hypothetical protein
MILPNIGPGGPWLRAPLGVWVCIDPPLAILYQGFPLAMHDPIDWVCEHDLGSRNFMVLDLRHGAGKLNVEEMVLYIRMLSSFIN